MIERQNILDLIGKNRGKYSSCIITTYTFDFTFFEERIMSILRTSNIKNVNVFLDGKYLDQHNETPNGNEFRTHKTYSLNKIYETGVFHPKIMLLTGPKHGLLIIGSGNLTTSGLSTNDEIWGAFHLNSLDSQNAALFATVWNYLQQYFLEVKGFNIQKITWITQRSPWLTEIKDLATNSFISINDLELKFIGNSKESSSYQELIRTLPKKDIKKLTIVSPYFDDEGKVLEQLTSDLKINETVCVSDSEFGLLPIKLNDTLTKQIKFYDWKECLKDFDKRFNRLHAKVFHFEYEDGWEYILLGSANATINAIGSKSVKPVNAEAGILLRRKMVKGYIHELGINYNKAKAINIKSYIRKPNNIGDNPFSVKFENKIIYAEINGRKLSAYLKEKLTHKSNLIVLNSDNTEIEKLNVNSETKEIQILLENPIEAYKIFLSDKGSRFTNFSFIHNVAYQSKCNPDPKHAEIDQIIESLSYDPENGQLIELLNYADYNWVDEELDNPHKVFAQPMLIDHSQEIHKVYDKITEEEFNRLNSIQSIGLDLLNNPSVQIADFLSIISRGLILPQSNVRESNEEAISKLSDEEQTGEGEVVEQTATYRINGELEARMIRRHLDKVRDFYSFQLKNLQKKNTLSALPNRPLTIKDLSNLSIALDLMFIYHGKKYPMHKTEIVINFNKKYVDAIARIEKTFKLIRKAKEHGGNRDWSYYNVESDWFDDVKKACINIDTKLWVEQKEYLRNTYFSDYMLAGVLNSSEGYGVKYYLIEMLGSFLLNANSLAGFKSYEYDLLNDKIFSLRNSIFEHATFLCLNLDWKESEAKYRDILFLDLLHFVYPKDVKENEAIIIRNSLKKIYSKAKYKYRGFFDNLNNYINNIVNNYILSKDYYKTDVPALVKVIKTSCLNSFIYTKETGFCLLRSSGMEFVLLEKPGLKWDSKLNANLQRVIYPGSLIKYYKIDNAL